MATMFGWAGRATGVFSEFAFMCLLYSLTLKKTGQPSRLRVLELLLSNGIFHLQVSLCLLSQSKLLVRMAWEPDD